LTDSHNLPIRFIPTCVGNIRTWKSSTAIVGGSSPRVWGTFQAMGGKLAWKRFIPTCVGNMNGQGKPVTGAAVHPHVCGEHV